MAELLPVIKASFYDSNGEPLAGGKLYSYEAGTSTPKATYTNRAGNVANTNPVVLDANGQADVWLGEGYYKFELENSSGDLQYTEDNIAAPQIGALESAFWRGVVYITSAESPYTVTTADNGKLIAVDSSGGAVSVILPEISSLTLPFNVGVKRSTGSNLVTVTRSGTDTINGNTSKSFSLVGMGCQFIGTNTTAPDKWETNDFLDFYDGVVTKAKLASDARDYTIRTVTFSSTSLEKNVSYTDDLILVDTSGGAFTLTMFAASSGSKPIRIKKITSDFNACTIQRSGSDTIKDVGTATTSTSLNTDGEELQIAASSSSLFQVVNRRIPSVTTSYSLTVGGTSGAPTLGAGAVATATTKRNGDIAEIVYTLRQAASGTAGTNTLYLFPLPSGLTVDTDKAAVPSTLPTHNTLGLGGTILGSAQINNTTAVNAAAVGTGSVIAYDTSNLYILGTAGGSDQGYPFSSSRNANFGSNPLYLTFRARVPITGWAG